MIHVNPLQIVQLGLAIQHVNVVLASLILVHIIYQEIQTVNVQITVLQPNQHHSIKFGLVIQLVLTFVIQIFQCVLEAYLETQTVTALHFVMLLKFVQLIKFGAQLSANAFVQSRKSAHLVAFGVMKLADAKEIMFENLYLNI